MNLRTFLSNQHFWTCGHSIKLSLTPHYCIVCKVYIQLLNATKQNTDKYILYTVHTFQNKKMYSFKRLPLINKKNTRKQNRSCCLAKLCTPLKCNYPTKNDYGIITSILILYSQNLPVKYYMVVTSI